MQRKEKQKITLCQHCPLKRQSMLKKREFRTQQEISSLSRSSRTFLRGQMVDIRCCLCCRVYWDSKHPALQLSQSTFNNTVALYKLLCMQKTSCSIDQLNTTNLQCKSNFNTSVHA